VCLGQDTSSSFLPTLMDVENVGVAFMRPDMLWVKLKFHPALVTSIRYISPGEQKIDPRTWLKPWSL